ncbi:MAG TPA: exopolysaccharide transport family protein [Pseudolabrys sp.]|nr:exopolysaccharide transport family protein [Pseudolabrys sp.]
MLFSKKSKVVAPSAPFAANGEPDMRALGRAVWQKKARIFGFTLLAAGLAFVAVDTITPRYQSESRLLLETRDSVFLRAESDKIGERGTVDPEAVTSQVQLVLSRDLAREVIKKEMLADNPEFDPANSGMPALRAILGAFGIARDPSTMSRDERTLEAYYDRLNAYAVEKSRVIAVSFSSANPELAALTANTIAETYLKMQQAVKQEQTRAAGIWLAGEIDKMRAKVADAEAKVEDYRSRANLFAGSNNTSLPSQQLTEINSQIAAARGQKADLEARARQLRDLINSSKPIESADIANSDAMRRLIEQRIAVRAQLAEQSTTLLDQHPRIKELKAQSAEIDRQIQVEGERLLRQLDNDATVARDRLGALVANLDQAKKLASETSEQDVQLRALEREAKTQRDLLESYLVKYREATARDSVNAAPPEARIISRATPASKPAYPKKAAVVLIAAFAVFALSAGLTVTGALLSTPTQYVYAAAPVVVSPPVAAAPLSATSAAKGPAVDYWRGPPPASPASTVEQVARNLRQAGSGNRCVTVAGTVRNVGTTYTAIMLARALAEDVPDANVVLVDLAFGAPNLSAISSEPNAPGIAELAQGAASIGDVINRDLHSRVHIIAAGRAGSDIATLASVPMLPTIIEALVHSYDYVVLDVGAIVDVAAIQFVPLASHVMLVALDPANAVTRIVRERLMQAGFSDVVVVAGGAQPIAA